MNIFKKLKKVVHNPKVSSKDGESITDWENDFLNKSVKKHKGKWMCPNCESDFLCDGPEGGMSQNIRCRTCGQGYNVSPMGIDNIGIDESWIDKKKVRAKKLNKLKDKLKWNQ